MQIKRFEAKTMTAALKMVKDEFGLEAVILSARTLRRNGLFGAGRPTGVEVTAARDYAWPGGAERCGRRPTRRRAGRTPATGAGCSSRSTRGCGRWPAPDGGGCGVRPGKPPRAGGAAPAPARPGGGARGRGRADRSDTAHAGLRFAPDAASAAAPRRGGACRTWGCRRAVGEGTRGPAPGRARRAGRRGQDDARDQARGGGGARERPTRRPDDLGRPADRGRGAAQDLRGHPGVADGRWFRRPTRRPASSRPSGRRTDRHRHPGRESRGGRPARRGAADARRRCRAARSTWC